MVVLSLSKKWVKGADKKAKDAKKALEDNSLYKAIVEHWIKERGKMEL